MNKKIFTIIIILIAIIASGYFWISAVNNNNLTTYQNKLWGIEFQYPDDWKIIKGKDYLTFQSPDVVAWELENENNCKKGVNCSGFPPYNLILSYWSMEEFEKQIGNDSIEEEIVSFGGLDYIKYGIFGSMIASDNYRIEKDGRIYNFEIIDNGEISEKIIESFKFTN